VPFSRSEANVPDYEEDPNSPFTATNTSSKTFTLARSAKKLLVLSDGTNTGFDQLQLNGITTASYNHLDNADSRTLGSSAFPVPGALNRGPLYLQETGGAVVMAVVPEGVTKGATVAGAVSISSSTISEITMQDSGGGNQDTRLRVFSIDV